MIREIRTGTADPECFKQMTNYDHLISKTPDEMTEWIESIEPATCPWRDDHGDNCRFTHCSDCWLDWLKSPVKEE